MTGVHVFLGIAVVALNAAVGAYALVPGHRPERLRSLAALAHGSLALQLVTGFFMSTSTSMGPNVWHAALPALALAAVLGLRMTGEMTQTKTVLASLLVVAASVYSYLTGIAHTG
ncbi:MAG: hypothetical protein HY775_04975 [Acidobacteria bacterium]|nr:hypothetical protein [Acidobacteriota bacterium]